MSNFSQMTVTDLDDYYKDLTLVLEGLRARNISNVARSEIIRIENKIKDTEKRLIEIDQELRNRI